MITSTSRRQPSRSASRIIRAIRGSIGSRASLRPTPVRRGRSPRLQARRAPSSSSSCTPARTARWSGGSTNGNRSTWPEPERGHLEDHAGQRGAQDLRLGELRPSLEVLLAVEPDRDAGLDPAAPTGPLLRGGLADRLDRQPLHLGAHRPAADPGEAGVDHRGDAGDGQERLGDVGGEHHAAPGVPLEDAVLLGGGEPRVERDDVEAPWALRPALRARRRCRGSPARPGGRRGCRRRCRRAARRRRPRSPRSGRAGPARPPRRRTTPRAAAGSAPRPGRCARRPR